MTWFAAAAALLGRIAEALARALPIALAFWAGRRGRRARDAEHIAEIKDEQLERAARRPRDRDELVRRLRRDGL
jgi:hypothetical protein